MSGWTKLDLQRRGQNKALPGSTPAGVLGGWSASRETDHPEPPLSFTISPVYVSKSVRRIPHSLNARLHWAVRSRWNKAWKNQTALEALVIRNGPPYEKATAVVTLRSTCLLDTDNAYACVKPILDGLKGILITDDSPDRLVLRVEQERVDKPYQEGVYVSVSPID